MITLELKGTAVFIGVGIGVGEGVGVDVTTGTVPPLTTVGTVPLADCPLLRAYPIATELK